MPGRIGIVGRGRLAGALQVLLSKRGLNVAVATREPRTREQVAVEQLPEHAENVIIAVSDDAIPDITSRLASSAMPLKLALHTSGAAGPEALSALRDRGTAVGVLHPLQTIPSADSGVTALCGASMAYAGDPSAQAWALDLIQLLGGVPLAIEPERWSFYHAAAVMVSNYQAALMDAALELMEGAGVTRGAAFQALTPLMRQANANVLALGPDRALTGPIVRGDVGTVLRHMRSLSMVPPAIRNLYAAAGKQTVKIAERSGLPAETAREMDRSLAQGTC